VEICEICGWILALWALWRCVKQEKGSHGGTADTAFWGNAEYENGGMGRAEFLGL